MIDDRPVPERRREERYTASNVLAPALEPWVVSLLACPVDRGAVRVQGSDLVCERCGRQFPVRGGIPCMLRDHGIPEQEF
jgi:uncharacterized protein YbaR (Trm112 family)